MSYLSQKQRVVTLQSTKVVAVLKEGSTGDTMNPLFMQFFSSVEKACAVGDWDNICPQTCSSLWILFPRYKHIFSCGFYLLKLNNH